MIETAVQTLLLAATALTPLLGGRVFFARQAPEYAADVRGDYAHHHIAGADL